MDKSYRQSFQLRAVLVLLAVAGLTGLTQPGCGRSDLFGFGDCVNNVNPNGTCQPPGSNEICGNGIDDDGNGLVDCADPACAGFSFCKNGGEICNNGIDDNGNGLVDCDDPACRMDPSCSNGRELCNNGRDDNGDGLVDCADPQCAGDPVCRRMVEICNDGLDNDGDGLIDCQDPDCRLDPSCSGVENCGNGVDDDGDGRTDCADPDCANDPRCKMLVENCTDGVDNDGDGLIDCQDPDCFSDPACRILGMEICNNGLDDDQDGLIDCADPDCQNQPICQTHGEICNNGIDDDGDGATDCADPDCTNAPNCMMNPTCNPEVDFGAIPQHGGRSERMFQTLGHGDNNRSMCSTPGGGDIVTTFTLQGAADVRLDWKQTGDHVFALFAAGVNQTCDANPRGCFDTNAAPSGSCDNNQTTCIVMHNLAAGTYYLVAEAFAAGQEGTLDVTLSTGDANQREICGNGIDDDNNGATDCADAACANDPACVNQLCKVDDNLGAVVIDGPPLVGALSTVGAGDDVHLTCANGGGADVTFRFVLPTAAGVIVDVSQTGDHVIGIFQDAGPGTRCDAGTGGCVDLEGQPQQRLVAGNLAAGVYYVILDALQPGDEGDVQVAITAFSNRGRELCGNGIDDDGDGLIDCADPDCIGTLGCQGAVCVPDLDVGSIAPNGSADFAVDTTQGFANERLSCAIGNGKAQVVRFTLTAQSDLAVSCTQAGDQVLGLFSEGGPRDRCDANEISCADISEPLGCDYIWPGLFPGTYYLIVEAFQSGGEGTLSGTLSAFPARTQEICDNGIDDDGDGLIDCADPFCSTFPACVAQTCHPDQSLGFLPIDGVARDVSVNTVRAGADQNLSCQSASGGGDVVIGFSLGQMANLALSWGGFGNANFGLFKNDGAGRKCDADPVDCRPSGGAQSGSTSFNSLAPGDYFLVVKADSPAGEGSLALELKATTH
jgi:hypothetical protein